TIPAIGLRAFSKKITTLISLVCSNIESIYGTDLFLIAECFPLLEELDLSNPGEFANHVNFLDGLDALSLALFKLRKINLSGHCYVNDSSLLHLCKNCEFLEQVMMMNCSLLTHHGIAYAIRERRQTLRSLSIRWRSYGSNDIISSHFVDSLANLKGLTSLDLSSSRISDKLLTSIAMRGLPLRKLVLQNCTGYSYVGIFSLLSKCQGIQHLDLQNADFMTDHRDAKVSSLLGDLVSINLNKCRKLTNSALSALVSNCPLLSDIKMEHTSIGKNVAKNSNYLMNFVLNPPRLKSFYMAHNSWLKDESLIIFSSILTNLQLLDLSDCDCISEQVSNLEVLNLSDTNVVDETLYAISKNCRGLLQIILEGCLLVTMKGVKHVVENCTQLREINLRDCDKVHLNANSVSLMVFSRPSLRKITAPPNFHLSEKKKLLSHQLCIVW
ncbi:F-box/LRR-repeat protein, partial [Trifolium pratense]